MRDISSSDAVPAGGSGSGQVLDRLLQGAGLRRDSQLADLLGVTPQAVSQARRKGRVPDGWVLRLASRFGLSTDWIYFGRGPAQPAPFSSSSSTLYGEAELPHAAGSMDMAFVPLVGARLAAGMGSLENGGEVEGDFAFGHAIYAVGVNEEIYIKQIETLPGGRLVLRSLNRNYAPLEVNLQEDLADSVRVIGRVIWWCREA